MGFMPPAIVETLVSSLNTSQPMSVDGGFQRRQGETECTPLGRAQSSVGEPQPTGGRGSEGWDPDRWVKGSKSSCLLASQNKTPNYNRNVDLNHFRLIALADGELTP